MLTWESLKRDAPSGESLRYIQVCVYFFLENATTGCDFLFHFRSSPLNTQPDCYSMQKRLCSKKNSGKWHVSRYSLSTITCVIIIMTNENWCIWTWFVGECLVTYWSLNLKGDQSSYIEYNIPNVYVKHDMNICLIYIYTSHTLLYQKSEATVCH